MNLKIDASKKRYRPVLISIYGSHPDNYQDIREKWFEKHINTPISVAMFADEGMHVIYNESLQYCIDNRIDILIIMHQSVCPKTDWSDYFRHLIKKFGFIYTDDFIVINVKKVRKFGFYKTIGANKEFLTWLGQKSKSEGFQFREFSAIEKTFVDKANMLPAEPDKQKTKKRKHRSKSSKQSNYKGYRKSHS